MAGELNRKSNEVVELWHRAAQRLEQLRSEVSKAECELKNAANAAGEHLCPDDAQIGEEFQMWIRTEHLGGFVENERIVVVSKLGEYDYSVSWRAKKRKATNQT